VATAVGGEGEGTTMTGEVMSGKGIVDIGEVAAMI